VALNAVQDAQHFFGRLGIILSPEKPQAARAVLVHEAPEGLVAGRNRGKHALIIRALSAGRIGDRPADDTWKDYFLGRPLYFFLNASLTCLLMSL
jgi:hypothetical protein